ncbi:MAG TPA: LD-carboxypeptidase [Candidatus Polarisedimenticolaceae bacterium]|nr:LD-carboxypeptidase [Candidatus Polarisedimenticolaceae bacterium]
MAARRLNGGRRRFLAPGDAIGVVATGFAVRPEKLDAGLARLHRWGYRVVTGAHLRDRDGYLAGSDRGRGDDLAAMLRNTEPSAIWFARGGYGTARLLDRVPWAALRRDPKLLIGYSDLTALFNAVVSRTASVCLYGPVVAELGDRASWHAPSLDALSRGRPYRLRLRAGQVLAPGRAAGTLVGGNLTVLTHLLGTRYAPDFRGRVLFLEETGEETYRVDRMLTHLRQSGALDRVAAVLVGAIDVPPRRRFPPDRSLAAVVEERLAPLGVPVLTGIPAGHLRAKRTIPLGARAVIDTDELAIRFEPRRA